MNKLYIYLLLAISVIACSPVEDRDSMGGAITADQLNITAEPIVINGKNTNRVAVVNHSPVLSQWNYGLGVSTLQTDTVLFAVKGQNSIFFKGLNPDGTFIEKVLTVNIEDLYYPVPPEWGYLCGIDGKTWIWDNSGAVWGNGGYLNDSAPAWWTLQEGDIDGQATAEGVGASMVFSLQGGANLTKVKSDGTQIKGTFFIDMSKGKTKGDGTVWSKGILKTSGVSVLCGISPNESGKAVSEYDILVLDENRMVLSYNEPGTSNSWFWVFKAK